jgi:hypothetical protein
MLVTEGKKKLKFEKGITILSISYLTIIISHAPSTIKHTLERRNTHVYRIECQGPVCRPQKLFFTSTVTTTFTRF